MNRADGPACARPARYAVMTTGPSKHPAGTSNPARTAAGSAGPHPQAAPTSAGQPSTPTDQTATDDNSQRARVDGTQPKRRSVEAAGARVALAAVHDDVRAGDP